MKKKKVKIMSEKDEREITRHTFTEKVVIRKGEGKEDEKEKE